jgi:hypothetical protein
MRIRAQCLQERRVNSVHRMVGKAIRMWLQACGCDTVHGRRLEHDYNTIHGRLWLEYDGKQLRITGP